MISCNGCGAQLHPLPGVYTVSCSSCWKTNLIGQGDIPVQAPLFPGSSCFLCGGCSGPIEPDDRHVHHCRGCRHHAHAGCWAAEHDRCKACARPRIAALERRARQIEQARAVQAAVLAGLRTGRAWGAWAIYQTLVLAAAILLAWGGKEGLDRIAGLGPGEQSPFGAYLAAAPFVIFGVGYLAALELGQSMAEWRRKLAASGQGGATLLLILWHNAILSAVRVLSVLLGGLAGVAVALLGPAHFAGFDRMGFAFAGCLVFLLVGFTGLSRLLYAAALLGGLALSAYSFDLLGRETILGIERGGYSWQWPVEKVFGGALQLTFLSALAFHGATLDTRRLDFCGRCAAYVRQDRPRCPRCDAAWGEPTERASGSRGGAPG